MTKFDALSVFAIAPGLGASHTTLRLITDGAIIVPNRIARLYKYQSGGAYLCPFCSNEFINYIGSTTAQQCGYCLTCYLDSEAHYLVIGHPC